MNDIEVDIAIIGAGTAGMSAYREARKTTDRLALIEGGPLGTTCARVGCMPSKLLIAAAEARHGLEKLPAFGIDPGEARVDGRAVMKRVRDERDRFVGSVEQAVGTFDQSHVFRTHARFADDHTLALDDGRRIRADRIVIATGSHPKILKQFAPAGDRIVTSDDVFYWDDLPHSVAVFGAGVIGIELGQALHRLGVRVRMFGKDCLVGPLTDPEVRRSAIRTISGEIPAALDAEGVEIARDGEQVVIRFEADGGRQEERFDYLLAATGRQPNLQGLELENTSLEIGEGGVPIYDALSTQCGDSAVFIAGDADNEVPLLHIASDDGRRAGQNAASWPRVYRQPRRTPLTVVFSEPRIAMAGATCSELNENGAEYAVGAVSFEDQGRARVMLVNRGLLRLYGEHGTGRLLGVEMIAPAGEHLAHLLAWSIASRLTVDEMLGRPFYHPTLEEGVRTALRELRSALGMGARPPANCLDRGPGG